MEYTSNDIEVLTDQEHVRKRVSVYLGNNNIIQSSLPVFVNDVFTIEQIDYCPAALRAVQEIVDNSLDEFTHLTGTKKILEMDAEPEKGIFSIGDNGRGVPITIHAAKKKHTPEVVFGSLRSGRNFSDDRKIGLQGQNGVGSSATNFCSKKFVVDIHRDNSHYTQRFTNGGLTISKPVIKPYGGKATGTKISFELDDAVFKSINIPSVLIKNKAFEIAFNNPGVTVVYNGEKFCYKHGIDEAIAKIVESHPGSKFYKFAIDVENCKGEIAVVFGANTSVDEQIFTWVNSSYMFDGGIFNTQFLNAFVDKVCTHLESAAKKQKCEVSKNDVRRDLIIVASLKVANPEFDAQSKTRLTGPSLRKELAELVDLQWKTFSKKSGDWLQLVLERAAARYHSSANKKATDDHAKKLTKRIPGLIDATSKHRLECSCIVVEGESALAQVTNARDPVKIGVYPMSGKIMNTHGMTPAQLLASEKMANLLKVFGLIPGRPASRGDMNFGKILIATDSDYDGDDIFTLVVNMLYSYWPELFDPRYEPIVYRLIAPNVCLVKGKQRIHFPSLAEFRKQESKYSGKGYEIKYFKGLGGMSTDDWEMILTNTKDSQLPVVDSDGKMKETLELLFGDNSNSRKAWLSPSYLGESA